MKTAIIYARVSTTRQSDEGISIESQIELGMKKASDLGANVLNVFHDDGKSGRSDPRSRSATNQNLNYSIGGTI